MSENRELTQKEKKQLAKQRKNAAKQAQKYHKEQEKKAKTSSAKSKKPSSSKIEEAVNSRRITNFENISREERYMRESEKKIRNLRPHDFKDGYYIDEYGARQKQQRRAKEIHEQEAEVVRRLKKPLTQKQIRLRRAVIYSAIFAVVLIIGAVLSLTVLFKTEKIEVEGDKYYYEDQIIAFSGVEYQQNIFVEAMSADAENISKNLPYVEKAEVTFSIPDTVIIKITNAVPSYVIENGNEYLIISSNGRILDSAANNADNLPLLKCEELDSVKPGDYVSFSDDNIPEILETVTESLKANDVKNITAFDVTDTANIMLVYDNRITINLGLPEDIDYKIRTAITIINDNLDPNNTGTVEGVLDVSSCNSNKISRFKPAETTEPSTSSTHPSAQAQSQTETTVPVPESGNYQDYSDSYVWNESTESTENTDDSDNGNYYDADGYNNGVSTEYGSAENANDGYYLQ